MPHSFGYRGRTRSMFQRAFRTKGHVKLSQYFITYKIGDLVDIKANGAVHAGMPHKFYHGRTGVVFNVTKTSVGIEVNKVLRGKILVKRIHVRVEHVRPSKCRLDFLNRVKANEVVKTAAKAKGLKVPNTKRTPRLPAPGAVIKVTEANKPKTLYPKMFVDLV